MIDWSIEWTRHKDSSSWNRWLKEKGISNEEYWDNHVFGDRYEEYNRLAGYPGKILDRMVRLLDSDSSVLDIGAGPGAFAIPLAKVARKVTVVEPSRGQVTRLMRRADREGLENIEVINKRWQDVELDELGSYRLVNAAYCFQMPDILEALQMMVDVTGGVLFLISMVDHGFTDVYESVFREKGTDPDYIYLYNVLHQMGYPANVEVITRHYQLPLDMQIEMLRGSYDFRPELEQRLIDYLDATGRVIERENGIWIKRTYKDGMIWYPKDR